MSGGNVAFDFSGRTVLITGAARGIGLALSRRFAGAGADVVMVDHDEAELAAAAAELGAPSIACDVSSTRDVEQAIAETVARTGRLDVVVNNAGILRDRMLRKLSDDDWEQVLGVHVGGTFRFTRAALPHFRAQGFGRVVNMTSYTGLHGNRGQAAYAAAKGGHHRLHEDSRQGARLLGCHGERDLPERRHEDDRRAAVGGRVRADRARRSLRTRPRSLMPCASWLRARPATSPAWSCPSTAVPRSEPSRPALRPSGDAGVTAGRNCCSRGRPRPATRHR